MEWNHRICSSAGCSYLGAPRQDIARCEMHLREGDERQRAECISSAPAIPRFGSSLWSLYLFSTITSRRPSNDRPATPNATLRRQYSCSGSFSSRVRGHFLARSLVVLASPVFLPCLCFYQLSSLERIASNPLSLLAWLFLSFHRFFLPPAATRCPNDLHLHPPPAYLPSTGI